MFAQKVSEDRGWKFMGIRLGDPKPRAFVTGGLNCGAGLRGQAICRVDSEILKCVLRGGGFVSTDTPWIAEQDSMDRRELELTDV